MNIYSQEDSFEFWIIGVSHHRSSLEVREKFALSPAAIQQICEEARTAGVSSIMLLTTCNRTEIYTYAADIERLLEIFAHHTRTSPAEFDAHVFTLRGKEAYQHIFEVAAGLDSQVLGDYQIVSQIREAYQRTQEQGFDDAYLSRLMQMVFHTGKRIKNETGLSAGKSSVSSVTVDYISSVPSVSDRKILLYGAGKIGRVTCQQLAASVPAENITVINRTFEKAAALAGEFGFCVLPESALLTAIHESDILIVATSSMEPVIIPSMLTGRNRDLLAFDLSVPRNIAPGVETMPGVQVVNMDQLQEIQDETFRFRRDSIPSAREIIREKMDELIGWLSHRKLLPYVNQVRSDVEIKRMQALNAVKHLLSEEEFVKADETSRKKAEKAISNYIAYLRRTPHNAENLPELDVEAIQFLQEE